MRFGAVSVDDGLYTDAVKKIIYYFKDRLPGDFPLVTKEREVYIIIRVQMEHYAWRTVEQRLAIALELEQMRTAIEGEGVGCLIEKVTIG